MSRSSFKPDTSAIVLLQFCAMYSDGQEESRVESSRDETPSQLVESGLGADFVRPDFVRVSEGEEESPGVSRDCTEMGRRDTT